MSYRPYSVIIQEAVTQAASQSGFLQTELDNNSGSSISAFQPVASDGNGEIKAIDPSVENDALKTLGVTTTSIADGSSGDVVTHGRLDNITTSFSFGDYVYVSKTGDLTNVEPSVGVASFVAGDWVIRIGTIVKNKTTPSQKDLMVNVTVVGQL